MELLRSVLGGGAAPDSSSTIASAADTIERLVDRLCNATMLDDRRDACRAIKAMSRKFRLEVGVQALEPVIAVLDTDRSDEEILGYALDTIANVCSPDEFEEELAAAKSNSGPADPGGGSLGEQFSEIFLKHGPRNVQLVIDLLEEFTFRVRRPAVKCLTNLLMNRPRQMQEQILLSQMGVSRLMDVLVDSREVLRNDALLLLIQLTKGNANLQKIVAFENCFDKLVDIVQNEGNSDGGIVVEDCLRLMLNLLRNNPSNQTFFREGSYIQRVVPFFELNLDDDEMEIGWSAQKVSNTLHMLQVIRTLVAPSNPTHITSSCQSTILTCSMLEKLCSILMSAGIPADILTETINTISESIRGCAPNQAFFSRVQAPSIPPRPALILLLMSMVNEKQPFALRCAVLYCFQCFLHKNPSGQHEVMRTLLPSSAPTEAPTAPPPAPEAPTAPGGAAALDVTTGQLLCGGLFAGDRLSNWFSCVALAHGLMDQKDLKRELLRVQLSTVNDNEPVSLLLQCVTILQQTSNIQTRVGLLILLSTWATDCSDAVSSLLSIPSLVPFLTGQIGSNEHDESERLGQGLCAFLLGLCIVGNDSSVAGSTQENLFQLVEKRIGAEVFVDKLGEVSKHESYNKALKQPQIKCQEARDLFFDHKFCQQFKHLEHVVLNHMNKRKEKTAASAEQETAQNDPAVVAQYKDLIREQDTRIQELTFANIYLQQELAATKQQLEELSGTMQTLRDENTVLRAQQLKPAQLNGPVSAAAKQQPEPAKLTDGERALLERDLRAKDAVIHELEERLMAASVASSGGVSGPSQVEMDMLNSQMQALHSALSAKDTELEQVRGQLGSGDSWLEVASLKEELTALRADQESLLVMLSDQDSRMSGYRSRLKDLGQSVEEDE